MKNKFFNPGYINHARWESYWAQLDETLKADPKTVLEIGRGSGVVSTILKGMGINVATVDIDKDLKPDTVADVRKLPFSKDSFDCVICCQVLEHLPFREFKKSLKELKRVSRGTIIISLPEPFTTYFRITAKIVPFVSVKTFVSKINILERYKSRNEAHEWEIGWKNTNYDSVVKIINDTGLSIVRTFCPEGNLYHRFFILSK